MTQGAVVKPATRAVPHTPAARVAATTWQPDPRQFLAVVFTVAGLGRWGGWLAFGDGTSEHVGHGGTVPHTYPVAGRYTAVLTAQDGRRTSTTVTVKTHAPVTWLYTNASTPFHRLLWIDEPDDGAVHRIQWGDRSPDTYIGPHRKTPPHPRVPHLYHQPGDYTVTVTDVDTRRETRHAVLIPGLGMSFTYPNSPDQPRLFTRCLTRWSTWRVFWGDGNTTSGTVDATADLHLLHSGTMSAGRYPVSVAEHPDQAMTPGVDGRDATRDITIPTDWDWRLDVWMTWRQFDDPPGEQTVTVTPRNASHPCRVDWGDGAPSSTVDPEATARHTYTLPVSPAGTPLYVREQPPSGSPDPVRVFHRLLAEPTRVAEPALSTRKPGAVDLVVAGLPNNDNADWYYIAWGDGTTQTYGAVGRWWTAVHTFNAETTYTVTVDGPGMPEPATRMITVRFYPAPVLSVREARAPQRDPGRRTVEATVDNTPPEHCGGPVRIRWATGEFTTVPERGRAEHTYPVDGTYTVIASCEADLTAKTRQDVTVPFGPTSTLDFDLLRHSPDDDYTVDMLVTAYDPAKTVQANWDDGSPTQVIPTVGRTSHTYTSGDYLVRVSYTDGSETRSSMISTPLQEVSA